jgi:tripartite-type tricarboxylate transporter receptor subunit TctC
MFVGAAAQPSDKWPTRPVRVIVPFPPGGPTDITARALGQALAASLGVQIVVENKAGGRGFVGMTDAARAPADGYTWS